MQINQPFSAGLFALVGWLLVGLFGWIVNVWFICVGLFVLDGRLMVG